MSEATGTIQVTYETPEKAKTAFESLHPDDDDFVTTRLEGSTIVATIRGKDARSLLRGADDVLACLGVAEDVMNEPSMGRPNA